MWRIRDLGVYSLKEINKTRLDGLERKTGRKGRDGVREYKVG